MCSVGLAFILLLLLVANPGVHGKHGADIDKLRSLWFVLLCAKVHTDIMFLKYIYFFPGVQCHCSECGVCAGGVSQCPDIGFPGCIIKLRKGGSLEQCCFDDYVEFILGCNNTLRDNGPQSLTPYEYCCTEDFCNTEQKLRSAIAARSTPVNVVSTSTSPLPSPTTAVGSYSENSEVGKKEFFF